MIQAVPFLSPNVGLVTKHLSKRSLINRPKKVTSRIARQTPSPIEKVLSFCGILSSFFKGKQKQFPDALSKKRLNRNNCPGISKDTPWVAEKVHDAHRIFSETFLQTAWGFLNLKNIFIPSNLHRKHLHKHFT